MTPRKPPHPAVPEPREEAMFEAELQLRRNGQPYCDGCGEPIPPTTGHTLGDATHCKACRGGATES